MEVELSWVEVDEAGWNWVEMDGAGWRWVHGLVISIYKKEIVSTLEFKRRMIDINILFEKEMT